MPSPWGLSRPAAYGGQVGPAISMRVRKMIDCLIAVPAIRADIPVLHADADFEVLARHTALRVERAMPS